MQIEEAEAETDELPPPLTVPLEMADVRQLREQASQRKTER